MADSTTEEIRTLLRRAWGEGSIYERLFDVLRERLGVADRVLYPVRARRYSSEVGLGPADTDRALLWLATSADLLGIRFSFHTPDGEEHPLGVLEGWEVYRERQFVDPNTGRAYQGAEAINRLVVEYLVTDRMRQAIREGAAHE